ncbi:MAG: HDIG domain-containing protein [Candidatus Omnitrophica bacterium]|nr:HDIG domain-containing protein [Candidatus Omnitrophota bacterium]
MIFCYFAELSLLIPLFLLFFGLQLFYVRKASWRTFLHLTFLLVLLMSAAHLLKFYGAFSLYYTPIAFVPMLATLLYNDIQLSWALSFMASGVIGLMIGFSLPEMVVFFMGSVCGSYVVQKARTREVFIKAGLYVGIVHLVSSLLIHMDLSLENSTKVLIPLAVNGIICSMIVMGTSRIFEYIFGEITNFTLLELSDSSQPLLQRLVLEAPGTYHHSIIVANLAESAAERIGAHSLLTRVGAYYHDVGKIEKPGYFTENQMITANKHDDLEPSMSRLVILNHIKEGIELAKEYKLNQRILDFIPEHHGTSLIHYFYQKALAEGETGEVGEEDYRYPGPKPRSKETAIVMLADSVEGATRALEEHTPQKIEDVVRKVINNKFIDGQLDECNLTLREIDAIASTFVRVLSAMYHSRVKYPERSNGHNGNKSSK